MYNENYINAFSQNQYQNALRNYGVLLKVKDAYVNKYHANGIFQTDIADILFKESLDHYVLRELKVNPNFINSSEMYNYMQFIISIYNLNELEFNTNIVFRDDKIRDLIFKTYLAAHKRTIEHKMVNTDDYYDYVIEKLKHKMIPSQRDLDFLCEYVAKIKIWVPKDNDVILKFIFGPMRNTNLKFSYQVQDYILNYLPNFYNREIANKVRLVVGDTNNGIPFKGPGRSSRLGNFVVLSKEFFKNVNLNSIDNSQVERLRSGSDITFFMIVALHELVHQSQKEGISSSQYNDQKMAYIIHVLTSQNLNDYEINHDSDGIEIDANMNAWKQAQLFFASYYSGPDRQKLLKNCYVNGNTSLVRRSFAYKQDKEGDFYPYDEYDVANLAYIIEKNPTYLKEYPMLLHFFTSDGKLKLSFMLQNSWYTKPTAMEFVKYFFKYGGLEKIFYFLDKNHLNDSEVLNLINNLYYYITQTFRKADNLLYVLAHNSAGEYTNNEEFSPYSVQKLCDIHLTSAFEACSKVYPLLRKIGKLYPNALEYVNWVTYDLNAKFAEYSHKKQQKIYTAKGRK